MMKIRSKGGRDPPVAGGRRATRECAERVPGTEGCPEALVVRDPNGVTFLGWPQDDRTQLRDAPGLVEPCRYRFAQHVLGPNDRYLPDLAGTKAQVGFVDDPSTGRDTYGIVILNHPATHAERDRRSVICGKDPKLCRYARISVTTGEPYAQECSHQCDGSDREEDRFDSPERGKSPLQGVSRDASAEATEQGDPQADR
jgi:hypothetical protein